MYQLMRSQCIPKFIVVDSQQFGSLLSKQTCIDLGLISIHIPVLSTIKSVLSEKSEIYARFPTVFEGVGKFKDVSVSIPVDKSVTPVVQPIRRVPFHLRKAVSNKVRELIDLDIIEPATGPTP